MNLDELKVLMISTDRNLLTPGSAVAERLKWGGSLVGELHIVLMCDRKHSLKSQQISKNVWVYPTNSLSRFLRPFTAAKMGKKIVLDNKFVRGQSLISTQDPFECGWAGQMIKKKWRLPLEVQLHTDPFSIYFSGFLNKIRMWLLHKVLPYADTMVVVNKSLLHRIEQDYPSLKGEIAVLPIYVDRKAIEEAKTGFDVHARFGWNFVLLSVARLTPEKNLGVMIRALKRVRQYYPRVGLVFVGEGTERSKLEALARSLGQKDSVAFVGWQTDTVSFYRTSDVFLQTSKFEGYGMALIEAGLSGLPVITTKVGIAEELEDGRDVITCPQDDDEELFKAIYELIGNNIMRQMLKMNLLTTLKEKLMSQEEYVDRIKDNWKKTAAKIAR
jgi:glycosyltransferase involved in cell wall biosynthesis